MANSSPRRPKEHYLLGLGGLLLIGFTLSVAKPLLAPLALAILLSFVLAPLVGRMERLGLPRAPAVFIIVCSAFAAMGVVGWVTALQVERLAVDLPDRKAEIREKLNGLRGLSGGAIGELFQMVRELDAEEAAPEQGDPSPEAPRVIVAEAPQDSSVARIIEATAPIAEPLATAGLVIVLVLFMLINREDLRDRIIGLFGHGRIAHTTRMLSATAARLSHYLLAQIALNAGVGFVVGVVIWCAGVPFALLGGLLVAILRFVPYIGTWLAAAFPLLLSIALFPGWGTTIGILVALVVIDLIVANVIEPLFLGHNAGVTPIALLVAAAFWTWIWGPVGLVLSTPLTVCLVVLGQHVPRFRFLALLLGGQAGFPPHVRYYQRLLAGDEPEARQWVEQFLAARGMEALADTMIIPALRLARLDRKRGELSAGEEQGIYAATERILQASLDMPWKIAPEGTGIWRLADGSAAPREAMPDAALSSAALSEATVIGCPAHHAAEGLIQGMFSAVVHSTGLETRTATSKALPIDIVEAIAACESPIVFISVLPPGGLPQARYLCESIRRVDAKTPIVVGYWGNKRQFDRVLVALRKAGASYVTTSLAQSRSQIEYLAERIRDKSANVPVPAAASTSSLTGSSRP